MDIDLILFQAVSDPTNSNLVEWLNTDLVDWLTFLVLLLTLCSVRKYTAITKKQTDMLIKQRQVSIMPIIQSELDGFISRDLKHELYFFPKLNIRNIGNGIAIKIYADNIALNNDLKTIFEFTEHLIYRPIDNNNSDKNSKFYAKNAIHGKGILNNKEEIRSYIEGKINDKKNYEMTIRFQDIEGTRYKVINKVIKGKYYQGITEPDLD